MRRTLFGVRRWTRAWIIAGWRPAITLHPGSWCAGLWWECGPLDVGIDLGPVVVSVERASGEGPAWPLGWTLGRLVAGRLEIKLDLDLNIWRLGVVVAASHDWGLYLGPFNIQFESDVRCDAPDPAPLLRIGRGQRRDTRA